MQQNEDAISAELGYSLGSVPKEEVTSAAVLVLDAIGHLKPRIQIMAVACVFYLMLRNTRLKPDDLMGYASNIAFSNKRDTGKMENTLAGLNWHVRNWLFGKSPL